MFFLNFILFLISTLSILFYFILFVYPICSSFPYYFCFSVLPLFWFFLSFNFIPHHFISFIFYQILVIILFIAFFLSFSWFIFLSILFYFMFYPILILNLLIAIFFYHFLDFFIQPLIIFFHLISILNLVLIVLITICFVFFLIFMIGNHTSWFFHVFLSIR
jgi:hypothetical protein